MLSQAYVCKVEAVARACRGPSRPMGVLKVILCGDFLQLHPVDKASDYSRLYNCQWWSSMQIRVVLFHKCIRPLAADCELGLNEMLMGRIQKEMLISVLEIEVPPESRGDFEAATRLRCLKAQVADYNATALA